jgi:hypothetical protein
MRQLACSSHMRFYQGVTVSLTERMNNATTLSFQRSVKGICRRLGALFFLLTVKPCLCSISWYVQEWCKKWDRWMSPPDYGVGVGVKIMICVGPDAGGGGRRASTTSRITSTPKLVTSSICDQWSQRSFFSAVCSYVCLMFCHPLILISLRLTSGRGCGTKTRVAQYRLMSQSSKGRKKSSKTRP